MKRNHSKRHRKRREKEAKRKREKQFHKKKRITGIQRSSNSGTWDYKSLLLALGIVVFVSLLIYLEPSDGNYLKSSRGLGRLLEVILRRLF